VTTNDIERWLVRFETRPAAKLRLLCFPHAGGAAGTFATWQRELPADVELCALQLPGRENRRAEPHRKDFATLVSELVTVLRPIHDRPVVLLGYSLGALIAFEYARSLRNADVTQLIVAARKAPQLEREPGIAHLTDDIFVREMGRRYGGIPKPILEDRELLAYFLPSIRADVTLLESYRYTPAAPLGCGITALGGDSDAQTTRAGLEAWGTHTVGHFATRQFRGGHFFVTPEERANVLGFIGSCLRDDSRIEANPEP
jgi:medium-chain acyl-[acyl-carrier-protein] hydrolase